MSDQLSTDDFAEVQAALWRARCQWYNIGVRLKMDTTDLDVIDKEAGYEIKDKFNRMVLSWFKMTGPCTWKVLYKALKHPTVNMPDVAQEIKPNWMKKELQTFFEISPNPSENKEETDTLDETSPSCSEVKDKAKETDNNEETSTDYSEVKDKVKVTESDDDDIKEKEKTKEEEKQLEKIFDDIILHAQEDMIRNKIKIRYLRHSIIRLPGDLKSEHELFVDKVKAELKKAESIEDIFLILDDYWDYLNYSLLEHIVDRHVSSDEVKKEMTEYANEIRSFRMKTRLNIFYHVHKRRPKVDEKFRSAVTKQDIDWFTATLEIVEKFRNDLCSELSLQRFSLQLAVVAQGCVEITWLVPPSLVAYIQESMKLSSPTMRNHHVSKLTIDGFIVYDSTIAIHNRRKVVRLQRQVIHVNYSYLLDEVAPDELVPHLVARRLLTPEEAKKVTERSDRLQRTITILEALLKGARVGMLHTFCATLCDTGQSIVAENITKEFHCLMGGESPSIPPNEDDIMISGEGIAQLSLPPPDSRVITAQVEGTTLTRAQYTRIASLMSSHLCIPTRALVYVGHTLHPLTLHWHCSAAEMGGDYLIAILSAMVQEGNMQINLGKKLDVMPQKNEMRLFESSFDGDVEGVKYILDTGVPVDIQDPNGETAMMHVSIYGLVEVMDTLLQHGARLDLKNNEGATALMIASVKGHAEVVDTLLLHGASADLQHKDGGTPLMIASQEGHVEVVDTLLLHGASADLQTKGGRTALMFASLKGHVKVVGTLLQRGASANIMDKAGRSVLIIASQYGHAEVVDTLLQHGANMDLQNYDGATALMIASQNGNIEVLDTLIKHGANVDLKKEASATALMMAIYHGLSGVIEALLRAKPDVNITTTGYSGNTALTLSCQREDLTTVCTLLMLGANPNVCTEEGQTPLLLAVRKRNIAMAREILRYGADPNHLQELSDVMKYLLGMFPQLPCISSSCLGRTVCSDVVL